MTDSLKSFQTVNELKSELSYPESHDLFWVADSEVVGMVENPLGQKYIVLRHQGIDGPQQRFVSAFPKSVLLHLTKEILKHLEPSALDPDSQIHQALRQIEDKIDRMRILS